MKKQKKLVSNFYDKQTKAEAELIALKAIVDAIYSGRIKVTVGKNDFNTFNHFYDISVVLGMIHTHIYAGLNLDIPCRKGVNLWD